MCIVPPVCDSTAPTPGFPPFWDTIFLLTRPIIALAFWAETLLLTLLEVYSKPIAATVTGTELKPSRLHLLLVQLIFGT